MKNTTLSIETAMAMMRSNEESIKSFALENYPELVIEKLPKSYDDCCISNENPSMKKYRPAKVALKKLVILREVYRCGWTPDWGDLSIKFCIHFYGKNIFKSDSVATSHFLSFQSAKIRYEFLKNFDDLIIEARPYMS